MGKYAKTAFLIAGFAGSVAFGGNHWYVDAENGNDGWDGTCTLSDAKPELKKGPKKTLAGIFSQGEALPAEGDTVHMAPGVYSNGVMTAASQNYRVVVPVGVTLMSEAGGCEGPRLRQSDCGVCTARRFSRNFGRTIARRTSAARVCGGAHSASDRRQIKE